MRASVVILSIGLGVGVAAAQYGRDQVPQPPEVTRGTTTAPFHEVTGRVRDVDAGTGRLVLDADGETLRLHFPSSALRDLRPGQTVVARIGIRSAIDGTSSKDAGSPAIDAETGSPGARPPGARRP